MEREDFILDEDGDFPLEDFVAAGVYLPTPYGNSENQHILDIIISHKGWIKQSPTIGFGVLSKVNSEFSVHGVEKDLNIELDKDNYKSKNGVIEPNNNGGFDINAEFISRK